jgi:hypothetical protein
MINNIQQLLSWTLAQRKNVIGEDKYLEGRISAIQDCIALLDEFEKDVISKTLDEVENIVEQIAPDFTSSQMYEFRKQLKEMQ